VSATITARSQLPIQPYRLWIPPEVASMFSLMDVRVGSLVLSPAVWLGGIDARQFSSGSGADLGARVVLPGMDVTLAVQHNGRHDIPCSFTASWAALVLPYDQAMRLAGRFSCGDQAHRAAPDDLERSEQLGSAIQDVRGLRVTPRVESPAPAGFGWDPFGDY
jgi:hypothetical protein